jgi:sulfur carrier protein ThiS
VGEGQDVGEYFRAMKLKINSLEQNFPAGTKLIELVNRVREANRDNPVLKSLIEKTGKDHITFSHNRRVVKPSEYDSIELKEGDEVRWMLPYAGGT